MKQLNTYITEKLHLRTGMGVELEDYDFKILLHSGSSNNSKKIVEHTKEKYDKDISARIAQDIVVDKCLVRNKFNRRDKVAITIGMTKDSGGFHVKSPINSRGYCVVFDEFMSLEAPWSFLVTKAASKVGKTLRGVEFVEPEDYTENIHEYDASGDDIPKTYFDDIDDAWEYIEKKYGKF